MSFDISRRNAMRRMGQGVAGAAALGAGIGASLIAPPAAADVTAYQIWSWTYYPDAYYGSNTPPSPIYATHGGVIPMYSVAQSVLNSLNEEEYGFQAGYNGYGVPAALRLHTGYGIYPVTMPSSAAATGSSLVNVNYYNGHSLEFQCVNGADVSEMFANFAGLQVSDPTTFSTIVEIALFGIGGPGWIQNLPSEIGWLAEVETLGIIAAEALTVAAGYGIYRMFGSYAAYAGRFFVPYPYSIGERMGL